MTYLERAQKLMDMLGQGQGKDAIDEFYADNVVIVEGNGDTFEGKETQKGRFDEWITSLEAMHGGGVYAITSNEEAGVSTIESWTEITFKGAPGPIKFEEVAIQYWEGDKIVRERFYYNTAAMQG